MRTFATILTLTLCAISKSCVTGAVTQYAIFKSFDTAYRECAEYFEVPNCTVDEYVVNAYPDDPEDKKLIRCALINLAAWSDESGVVESVMGNFFNPAPEDTCYADRTRDCIAASQTPCSDNQTLAYNAFQCYYRQYGNLNQSDQFVPYSPLEQQQLVLDSFAFVNVPQDELNNYSNGNVLDQPHAAELLYVLFVRGYFYIPGQGLLLQVLYTQFGNPELLTPETQQCVDAAKDAWDGNSQKDLVLAFFVNCLQNITPWLDLVQNVATAVLTVPPPPCPEPVTTTTTAPTTTTTTAPPPSTAQPCYNLKN